MWNWILFILTFVCFDIYWNSLRVYLCSLEQMDAQCSPDAEGMYTMSQEETSGFIQVSSFLLVPYEQWKLSYDLTLMLYIPTDIFGEVISPLFIDGYIFCDHAFLSCDGAFWMTYLQSTFFRALWHITSMPYSTNYRKLGLLLRIWL